MTSARPPHALQDSDERDRPGPAEVDVQVHTDREALDRLGPELDELHRATGAPVTARRPWVQTWLAAHQDQALLAVTVHCGKELAAAAVLVRSPGRVSRVRLAGAGASDETRLPAVDEGAARMLAAGVVDALARLDRPWRLALRDLPSGDPVVAELSRLLPRSAVLTGDASPRLVLGRERTLRAHVSRNHHQQSRRLLNRLQRDGHAVDVAHLVDREAVAAVLPEVEHVCRLRDAELRRRSSMDDPVQRRFFRDVVLLLAGRGEVELTTLRIDGALAAYDLCFRDGGAWRMWNCRFDPALARYGPGRLAHDASMSSAIEQGAVLYDWMRGEEAYKQGLSDHVHRAVDLFATSGPLLWAVDDGARRTHRRLRDLKDSRPSWARAWERLRPVLAPGR